MTWGSDSASTTRDSRKRLSKKTMSSHSMTSGKSWDDMSLEYDAAEKNPAVVHFVGTNTPNEKARTATDPSNSEPSQDTQMDSERKAPKPAPAEGPVWHAIEGLWKGSAEALRGMDVEEVDKVFDDESLKRYL